MRRYIYYIVDVTSFWNILVRVDLIMDKVQRFNPKTSRWTTITKEGFKILKAKEINFQ